MIEIPIYFLFHDAEEEGELTDGKPASSQTSQTGRAFLEYLESKAFPQGLKAKRLFPFAIQNDASNGVLKLTNCSQ
jgi:hypothetical protein